MTSAVLQENVQTLVAKAQAAYAAQDMAAACAAVDAAVRQAPDHPALAFMQAQFHWEGWFEAAPLFERAALLNPGNPEVVRNFALALASEGQGERAMRLLEGILSRSPGWVEGHTTLATLRTTSGDDDPLRGFAEAVRLEPANAALMQAWFHKLVAARDWDGARKVLALGEMPLLRLWLDCESGEAKGDPAIFADYEGSNDPGLALLQVRHALRHGDPARALTLAERQLGTPQAGQFWPYCSLCWRLTGDERADWLEGDFVRPLDLDLSEKTLTDLAVLLRGLHRMAAPYPEQSVRGGTQTERNLLLHHDPLILQLREKITDAVRSWRDNLADDPTHPLLSRKPEAIRFTGSWSVRLAGGGHHSAHTHPHGWASSALYIAVPPETGRDHAGELALGMPPPELRLGLEPTYYITPQPGRLALFPSTTWHGTVPFEGEERLTVAFDVAPATTGSTR